MSSKKLEMKLSKTKRAYLLRIFNKRTIEQLRKEICFNLKIFVFEVLRAPQTFEQLIAKVSNIKDI